MRFTISNRIAKSRKDLIQKKSIEKLKYIFVKILPYEMVPGGFPAAEGLP